MVERLAGAKGVAGGELCGGGGFGRIWGPGLRWLPVEAEGLGGSARSRGKGWWHWMDGGALLATNGAGGWRQPNWPETREKAFPRRWLAVVALE